MKRVQLFLAVLFCAHRFLSANNSQLIGVYSGSFDPPTMAHHKIILAALQEQQFDQLIIYVNQFGKKPYQANPLERKKMLEIMLEDQADSISVIIQSNPDKRIDYRNIQGSDHRLALIIGEDSYFKRLTLPEIQKIPVDKIFVIPRASVYTALQQALVPNAQIMYIPNIDGISSTKIRQQLRSGDFSDIKLNESVQRYIVANRLYSVPGENSGQDAKQRKVLLQQQTSDLSKLLNDAAQTQSRLRDFLTEFAKNYPTSRLYIPAIKGNETIQNLLKTRWNGDASMITDYARATISFPTVEMMYQGLEDLQKSGLLILQVTDNFLTPCLGGYRDITIIFRDLENAHLAEMQFNIHTIMDFKNGLGTSLFHVIRALQSIPVLEKRPLTKEEQICLDMLFEKERLGYDAALRKATLSNEATFRRE